MRCCCGKYKDIDETLICNQTMHEVLGPPGNLCGPVDSHIIRDQYKAVRELKEALELTVPYMQEAARKNYIDVIALNVVVVTLAKYKEVK